MRTESVVTATMQRFNGFSRSYFTREETTDTAFMMSVNSGGAGDGSARGGASSGGVRNVVFSDGKFLMFRRGQCTT